MPLRDILLLIDSYPEATPSTAIEQAVRFAAAVDGVISGLAVEVDIPAPTNQLAEKVLGLRRVEREEEEKSRNACRVALDVFTAKARAAGVFGQATQGKAGLAGVGEYAAEQARTRDLCIVPVGPMLEGQRSIAEAVVFRSGRPVLVFRPVVAGLVNGRLDTVVLAWDGSRAAARAMADALPILLKARQVRVLTVVNEKEDARPGLGQEAARHLTAHGVNVIVDEVDLAGQSIGRTLEGYAARCSADLLVMGAFGRTRLRDFILGGATEQLLTDPKIPILLAH